MEADGAVCWNVSSRFWYKERNIDHNAEIGAEPTYFVQNLLVLEVWRLDDWKSLLQRELLDWIHRLALFVGRTIDSNDFVIAFFQDGFQTIFTEGLLAHDDQSHG